MLVWIKYLYALDVNAMIITGVVFVIKILGLGWKMQIICSFIQPGLFLKIVYILILSMHVFDVFIVVLNCALLCFLTAGGR